jgi:hypothetical protein
MAIARIVFNGTPSVNSEVVGFVKFWLINWAINRAQGNPYARCSRAQLKPILPTTSGAFSGNGISMHAEIAAPSPFRRVWR